MTKVTKCTNCRPNAFQDQTYGDKMRVHNKAGGPNAGDKWRCTCCGNVAEGAAKKK